MQENTANLTLEKAKAFFAKGKKVAQANNFDYAIDMYLEGLRCAPDALEYGHQALLELALQRRSKGGKKPSMVEKMKLLRGKHEPLDQLLMAEYLFAKDPDHLPYAEAMLKAAIAGDYGKTARWIADLLLQANNRAKKPSLNTYILLKDSYKSMGLFDRAILACQHAVRLKPDDAELADEFRRLNAEMALVKGRYDQDGDFRNSIKDREMQEKLHAQDGVVKTANYRLKAVEDARKAMANDSLTPKNIFKLANVLSDMQTDDAENEAIELLEDSYERKSDFSYRQLAGEIRMKQIRRKIRASKSALENNPQDKDAKARLMQLGVDLNKAETEHYRRCVANYPTDPRFKYEYGICFLRNRKYDEAIPLFQEAQKDLKRKISAMSKIGLCFFMKGWYSDAIDIFNQALNGCEIKDGAIGKELRYNLARAYEHNKGTEKALELYRKIAQLDFSYRDVRERIENLRNSK